MSKDCFENLRKLQPGGKTCKYKTTPQIASTSSPKTIVAKPPFPRDDQETKCHYLELLVLFPQPLDFALQPLTLFHHLLNFSVIQGGTQSFRHQSPQTLHQIILPASSDTRWTLLCGVGKVLPEFRGGEMIPGLRNQGCLPGGGGIGLL